MASFDKTYLHKLSSSYQLHNLAHLLLLDTVVEIIFHQFYGKHEVKMKWWEAYFHEFCGKMNYTEFTVNKFPVEFGLQGVDEFTPSSVIGLLCRSFVFQGASLEMIRVLDGW